METPVSGATARARVAPTMELPTTAVVRTLPDASEAAPMEAIAAALYDPGRPLKSSVATTKVRARPARGAVAARGWGRAPARKAVGDWQARSRSPPARAQRDSLLAPRQLPTPGADIFQATDRVTRDMAQALGAAAVRGVARPPARGARPYRRDRAHWGKGAQRSGVEGDLVPLPHCSHRVRLLRKPAPPTVRRWRKDFLQLCAAHPPATEEDAASRFATFLDGRLNQE